MGSQGCGKMVGFGNAPVVESKSLSHIEICISLLIQRLHQEFKTINLFYWYNFIYY